MDKVTNFAWPVTSVNREDKVCFDKWFEEHKDILKERSVIIWGAGIRGTVFSLFFERKGYTNILFTDNDEGKWGGYINAFEIIPPRKAFTYVTEKRSIFLISTENSDEIEENLSKQGYQISSEFFVIKTHLYDKYIWEFARKYNKNILMLGDCEFSTISLNDTDTSNLAEMLKTCLGEDQCKILAMHGMGLRSHYHVLKAQIENKMCPGILVLMINLDTLTGKQHLLPRSQHEQLLRRVYAYISMQDEEFEEYLGDVHERTKNIQVEFSTEKPRTETAQREVKARNYFKINYLYNLNIETEGMKYLVKILELAGEKHIKAILFVPPVNYEYGENLFGEVFLKKYEDNISKIKKIVEGQGYGLLDLSYILPAVMFAEENTPDETANELGRRRVAEKIISEIERMR